MTTEKNYFSLNIEANNDQDIIIQVKDKKTGNVVTMTLEEYKAKQEQLKNNEEPRYEYFGKNSKLYGKMMVDGHIFNPYLHRRWLPIQFKEILATHRESRFYTHFTTKDAMRFLQEEMEKLIMLKTKSPEAYEIRKQFFTPQVCASEFIEYANKVLDIINTETKHLIRYNGEEYYRITGIGKVKKQNLRVLKYRYNKFIADLRLAISYEYVLKITKAFKYDCLGWSGIDYCHSDAYIEAFKCAGCWYTMQHMIMFENKNFLKSCFSNDYFNTEESLRQLRKMIGYSYDSLINYYCDLERCNA